MTTANGSGKTRGEIVAWADALYHDLRFEAARTWIKAAPGRRAVGHLPVYAPRELIHACGMLPVGIYGGGDQIEIIRGDAFYQSYICQIPRSVIELAQSNRLDFLSGMLFPSTCDVIRNLSGVWQLNYPDLYVRYVDLPHVAGEAGVRFWEHELRTLYADLARVAGVAPSPERLAASIAAFNEARSLIRALYALRRDEPWRVPTEELYLLMRAGEVVPVEEFIAQAKAYLAVAARDAAPLKDRCRVIVVGAFCEQPPLGLIKTIERAGCYIVDDDFIVGNRMLLEPVPTDGEPISALARALIDHGEKTSVIYERDPQGKRALMPARVAAARADGIIFAAPSFCDPALLDRPMLRDGAEAANIPCIAFKYAENTGQFQQFREQAGTFADALKLWGGQQ